jgi:hypothetical protein
MHRRVGIDDSDDRGCTQQEEHGFNSSGVNEVSVVRLTCKSSVARNRHSDSVVKA